MLTMSCSSKVYGQPRFNFKDGVRQGPRRLNLPVARSRTNFRLVTSATVNRVLFEDPVDKTRVTGVEFVSKEGTQRASVSPKGLVCCCAGALHTPKVLFMSGIGPLEQLKRIENVLGRVGIDSSRYIVNENVGRNLVDNPVVSLDVQSEEMAAFEYSTINSKPDPTAVELYINQHSGPYAFSSPIFVAFDSSVNPSSGSECFVRITVIN